MGQMNVVEFVDSVPPASATGAKTKLTGKYAELAKSLRANRGKFARIEGVSGGMATHINKGTLVDFRPAGAYEAYVRRTNGGYDLYVRYKGGRPRNGATK